MIPVRADPATRIERTSARMRAAGETLEVVFLLDIMYVSFQKIFLILKERPLRGSLFF